MQKKYDSIFVISGPSGSGKTSVIEALLKKDPRFKVAISATTRPIRPGETDAVDYYFFDREQFLYGIKKDQFMEHAEIYGNYYGTLKSEIERLQKQGCIVLFNKDFQGFTTLRKTCPTVGIFLSPPSIEILKERLTTRNQDDKEIIEQRLDEAEKELQHATAYDYIVTNDDFKQCVNQVYEIICNSLNR